MSDTFAITNAQVVTPERVIEGGAVVVANGRIAAVLEGRNELPAGLSREEDARGAILMPGIIDLHNDSLETEVNPRPGANLPVPFALANLERRLLASGVTTEFHAISFMEMAKSNRTVNQAAERAALVRELRRSCAVDHHVLHRLDVWNPASLDALFESVGRFETGYVSLNDHTPGQGQYRDLVRYKEFMGRWRVERGGPSLEADEIEERMRSRNEDHATIPGVYARVAQERELRPFVLSTHDDDSPEKVDAQWELGATVAEFPVTMDAAKRARERGMTIIVGAPNIVRGGSTSGNLDARDLFAAGLADVICADYHAPSLLLSGLRLVDEGLIDLAGAVKALTLNAAEAVGLEKRGAIREGYRADLLIAARGSDGLPSVRAVYRDGHEVLSLSPVPVEVGAW